MEDYHTKFTHQEFDYILRVLHTPLNHDYVLNQLNLTTEQFLNLIRKTEKLAEGQHITFSEDEFLDLTRTYRYCCHANGEEELSTLVGFSWEEALTLADKIDSIAESK